MVNSTIHKSIGRIKDRSGERFGKLTILRLSRRDNGVTYWLCKCDCGTVKEYRSGNLSAKAYGTKSCGCVKRAMDIVPGFSCEGRTAKYPNGRRGTLAGYEAHKKMHEESCPECRKAYLAHHHARHVREPRWVVDGTYGITAVQYQELLAAQGGVCAICGAEPGKDGNTFLCVDHDHSCCPGPTSCGKCVRGLLCSKCNVAIGFFYDDVTSLRNAANYLENFTNK